MMLYSLIHISFFSTVHVAFDDDDMSIRSKMR